MIYKSPTSIKNQGAIKNQRVANYRATRMHSANYIYNVST